MKKLVVALGLAGAVVVPALLTGHSAYALDQKGVATNARAILARARVIHAEAFADLNNARREEELAAAAWRRAGINLKQSVAIELEAAHILGEEKEVKASLACWEAHVLQHKAMQLESRGARFAEAATAATNDAAIARQEIARIQQALSAATEESRKKLLQEQLRKWEAMQNRDLADAKRDKELADKANNDARNDLVEAQRLKAAANQLVAESCK